MDDPTDLLTRLASLDKRFAVLPVMPADADDEGDSEGGASWLAADRLCDPDAADLVMALDAETRASGYASPHAAALSRIAAYACTVTTAAVAS